MCRVKRFSFWPCFLEYMQLPVLTKKLKYFTKSPGGQSDDIRQQQSDSGVCVFSLLVSHSYVYVICWWQDPLEFLPSKISCFAPLRAWPNTAVTMILKFSITAAAIHICVCVCVCVCIPSFQLLTTCLLWGKTHALFLRGGICFELVESLDTVKCLRKTQIRAAGTKGFNSCSAAMEKTVASRTLASHSSPKMGLALSPRMEGCVLQCGHKKGGKEGWAGEWGGFLLC